MSKPEHSRKPKMVFLFPGQGSQYYQMGRELFDGDKGFRELMTSLDDWYQRREGYSLIEELYGPKSIQVPLVDIRYSHPLVVLVEYSLAMVLLRNGLEPDLVIGFSLGEYSAHAFAGRMTIHRALEMAARQAEWAGAHVEDGFLMAVLEHRHFYDENPDVKWLAYLAGVSFPGAIVLAGARRNLGALENALRTRRVSYQVLPVRVPFHSPLLEPMRNHWMGYFGSDTACQERLPILKQFTEPRSGSYAKSLWRAVREPGEFQSLLERLDADEPHIFVDVGPSGTLANWVKHGGRGRECWQALSILSPLGGDLTRFKKIILP
ncbi:MAG TPA: acyltransferase domain-containing protein [Acidiferrobacterales bacterium]